MPEHKTMFFSIEKDGMASDTPHVVLIMADHLRWDCISQYGSINVQTPNLDALAEESIIFDNAYCTSPLCVPARVSIYTGKHPHVHGAVVNGHIYEEEKDFSTAGPDHQSLYECLQNEGYGINHVGIHHCRLEPPLHERVPGMNFLGLEEWVAYMEEKGLDAGVMYDDKAHVPNLEWCGGKPVMAMRPQARKIPFPYDASDYLDVWWSRRAMDMIMNLDVNTPQFIETLFWAPHPPLSVPEPYYSMYPGRTIDLPETVGRWCDGQPASLLAQSCGQMGLGLNREEYREGWSAYLGLVTMLDECIGRVIAALKERGIWDNALVVFAQDHGDLMGCHHLTQKHCLYEEAAHIPLLIKPPGGSNGRREELASALDICATVCDYAQLVPPDGLEGRSLRPVIEKTYGRWRNSVYMEYSGDQGRNPWPMRGIVSDVNGTLYKYIHTKGDRDELYDLKSDRQETRSLSTNPDYAGIKVFLKGLLAEWMKETGDTETLT